MADIRAGAATHTGMVRPENEDNMLVTDRVFVVADGMGGHEAGEVASEIVVARIGELLDDRTPSAEEVVEAIRTANSDIFRAAIAEPDQQGMGTTVTAMAVIGDPYAGRAAPNIDLHRPAASDPADDDDTPGDVTPVVPAEPSEALILANVGDSRTYLFRHGRLSRVTIDHSYVQELVSTGHITEDEARNHPRRNIVTRALGIEPEVRIDWWTLPLIRGDRFLLCSDGLVDEVDDIDIADTLRSESDPQAAAERLVEQANEAGGRDNTTVVVVDIIDGDEPPDPTQELDLAPVWAQVGTDPTPAGTLELDADSDATASGLDAANAELADKNKAHKRATRRRLVAGFVVAAVAVVGLVVFSTWARSGWFVTFDDDDQAIIFRGRPGGVLWIDPTAENAAGPSREEFEPEVAEAIDDQPTFDSFEEAREFINDGTTTTTSTTTTTTTTTTPPTTTVAPAGDASAPGGVTTTAAP
jgi:protein phosphatase